jgi:hypothetical protein
MPRPRGSKNKVQACARENVVCVFNRLGGTAYMADWARENPSDFFKIYARLVPQELKTAIDPNANEIRVTVTFVDSE